MKENIADKINYFETCLDDIRNFIQMYRDGEYNNFEDPDSEFLSDIAINAQAIYDESMRD